MTRTEQVLSAIQQEVAKRAEEINAGKTLKSIRCMIKFDTRSKALPVDTANISLEWEQRYKV